MTKLLRLAGLLVLFAFTAQLALATPTQTPITGHFGGVGPNPSNPTVYQVRFALAYCNGNTPTIPGVGTLPSTVATFTTDSTGLLTGAVWGNDLIVCGSQTGGTRYNVSYLVNGSQSGATVCYQVLSTSGTFNLDSAIPCPLVPPAPPPPPPFPDGNFRNVLVNGQLIAGNTTIYGALNGVFFSQPGDTIASIEAECSSPCTYVVTTPQVITLTANHTLSPNVYLEFKASGTWTVSGGFLTIYSGMVGTISAHFIGPGGILFGPNQRYAPVEWFGAAGDGVTNDSVAIQATLNALPSGQAVLQGKTYVAYGLTINKNNVGIVGTGPSFASPTIYATPVGQSTLLSTSASANVISVNGVSQSNTTLWNQFENFSIQRSLAPSGTASGISLNYTYGVIIKTVSIEDSINGIYVHASGSQGLGVIENTVITVGYRGLSEAGGTYYGINTDSTDDKASPSFRVRNSFFASNLGSTATTYGTFIHGSSLNDQMYYGWETAGATYGAYIVQTAQTGPISGSDIHFFGAINDGYLAGGFFISGLQTAGSGRVEINGGYNASRFASTSGVDIESSVGVAVIGVQFAAATNNYNNAIFVHNSQDCQIIGNIVNSVTADGIVLGGSTAISVIGNNLKSAGATNGLIRLSSTSTLNSITGNTMTGSSGASLVVDATSINNTGLYTNTIASTLSPASVLGLNPFFLGLNYIVSGIAPPTGSCANPGSMWLNSRTTTGDFAWYQCKGTAWVGVGTAY